MLQKYFFLIISVFVGLGFFAWDISKDLVPYIEIMLGLVIFSMAVTLNFQDFKPAFSEPKALCTGIAAQYLFMPMIAFSLAKLLNLPSEFAIGLILVGSAPGGTVSNVIVYISKADLPLSIAMTFFSTLIAPVMIPFMMWVYASQWIEINAKGLFISTVQVVLIPLLLGLFVNKFTKKSEKLDSIASFTATIFVGLIINAMVAINVEKFNSLENNWSLLALIFSAIFLHNALGFISGFFISKRLGLGSAQAKAISIEVGIQNSGLASVLAITYFNPLSVIPSVISAIWHSLAGSALASYWASKKN